MRQAGPAAPGSAAAAAPLRGRGAGARGNRARRLAASAGHAVAEAAAAMKRSGSKEGERGELVSVVCVTPDLRIRLPQ